VLLEDNHAPRQQRLFVLDQDDVIEAWWASRPIVAFPPEPAAPLTYQRDWLEDLYDIEDDSDLG